ncbi:aminotransferase class IV family protein [Kitasatospora sp. NPDC057015]|uniref:aminotransferase class IV family protein n=1 Tax=Kitasatospora sp. NPDC057015 TaxID=3346001 RepID=UPI00363CEB5F
MAELNGGPVGADELRALALTNYGHFTTMRVEGGRVRGLALHLARLARDCRAVFGADLDAGRVRELARRAAPASGTGIVRITVFDPALDIGRLGADGEPQVLVTARPAGGLQLPPLRVKSVEFVRDAPEIKSVGLFGALLQRRAAQLAGFDDALFTDAAGTVSEGGTWNVGFVRGGEVVWPDAPCLAGTTMELVRQVHPGTDESVRLTDPAGFDAAFATNVAIGVRAIRTIDGLELPGGHPVIERLQRAYLDIPGDRL